MYSGRRAVPIALSAVVLLLGLLATAGVSAAPGRQERRSAGQAMDRQVGLVQVAVGGESLLLPHEPPRTHRLDDESWRWLRRPAALRAANHNVK